MVPWVRSRIRCKLANLPLARLGAPSRAFYLLRRRARPLSMFSRQREGGRTRVCASALSFSSIMHISSARSQWSESIGLDGCFVGGGGKGEPRKTCTQTNDFNWTFYFRYNVLAAKFCVTLAFIIAGNSSSVHSDSSLDRSSWKPCWGFTVQQRSQSSYLFRSEHLSHSAECTSTRCTYRLHLSCSPARIEP